MKLLCITDIHNHRQVLTRILAEAGPVDLILLGGDLTNFGTPEEATAVVRQAQAGGSAVLAVAGNCDSADIERGLVELGVSLHGRGVVRDGVGLHGLSAMPPWLDWMYQFSEHELGAHLAAGYTQVETAPRHVVLSHAPPYDGRLDRTTAGEHVGSTALRAMIDRKQPTLVVCGHIHEGRGIERLGRTTVVNCGHAAAGSYALAELNEDVTVELRQA